MKRFVPIVAALLVVFANSLANAESYAGFRMGVNMASFVGDDADEIPGTRTGFTGGGFIGFDSGKHLGFRTDLLYTMKGGTFDDGYSEIKVDYIEVAPLLVVRFPITGRFAVRGFVGPMMGLWVSAEAATLFDDGVDEGEVDIDLGEAVEHWEFSGVFGAELNVTTGPYVTLFEVRYSQGSRVFEDNATLQGQPIDLQVSNSGLAFMAGLMVPF